MPNKEITIAGGPNNTKAMVTGQEELLVKVNSTGSTQVITPNLIRTSGVDVIINVVSATFANVGTGDITVLGTIVKPGEVVGFDAGIGNFYSSINYDASTSELLISFNTL